jgi:hypothetical protein
MKRVLRETRYASITFVGCGGGGAQGSLRPNRRVLVIVVPRLPRHRAAVDGPNFQHVAIVVPNFSRTFSTKTPQVYSNYCFSVMLLPALRRINPPDSDALSRRVPIISFKSTHSFIDALLTRLPLAHVIQPMD